MTEYALTTADALAAGQTVRPALRGKELARLVVLAAFFGDVVVTLAALFGAFFLRFYTPLRELGTYSFEMPLSDYAGHIVCEAALLVLVFHHLGLYNSHSPMRWRRVAPTVAAGCAIWCLSLAALTTLLSFQTLISRLYLLTAWGTATGALLLWRIALDSAVRSRPISDRLRRRILCVGWSEEASQLARHIAADGRHPYAIVGAVPGAEGEYALDLSNGVRHLGEHGDLRRILARHGVDMVMVCDPDPSRDALLALASLCEKEMVDFKVIPSGFQILLSGLNLETVSGVPVLGISRLPLHSPFAALAKRAVDIVGAVVGLVFGAPLIAIFGTLVYLESPGPIFYRQRRNGVDGRSFFILKIRSMKLDAEVAGARPGWTQADDPRRLRVGALMRRTNVDEIPQFLNVLRGEMSLVGPRPERPEFIVDFKEAIPHYNARHAIKPGITGWAQVNGLRGDTDLTERVKCDLFYIENWSLLMDLQIMFMTFWKRKGAC